MIRPFDIKGSNRRLELELCAACAAVGILMGVSPMKPHRFEAFGGAHLQAGGNPLDGQGRFLPRIRQYACTCQPVFWQASASVFRKSCRSTSSTKISSRPRGARTPHSAFRSQSTPLASCAAWTNDDKLPANRKHHPDATSGLTPFWRGMRGGAVCHISAISAGVRA